MGIAVATISSEGQALNPTVEVMSVEIHRELNRIPEATLVVLDGSPTRTFAASNTDFFEPGRNITIALRYEGAEDTPLFDGLVVRHSVETRADGSLLRVELKDRAFKLTRRRNSRVFHNRGDDEVFHKLITDTAGLQAGKLEVTPFKHDELIQYYASDWDFMVMRADVQGLVVDVDRGMVSVRRMALAGQPKLTLAHGLGDLSELELEIDAAEQWAELESVGWDLPQQKLGAPARAKEPAVKVGNLDTGAVAKKLGGDSYALLHPGALDHAELKAWADARLARSRFAMLRGRAVVSGDADLAPLDSVKVVGVGERFDGKVLVSAVTHRVDHGGWQTELRLGLSPEWFARQPDIAEVSAGGLLPPISGLQIATVAPFEPDPRGEHRIKVKLPALDPRQGFVWARVARPDAGEGRGQVFWPEPEDEVVVGFLEGDPRHAIVVGALHGSAKPPPALVSGPSEANKMRAIVSKGGSLVGFDDENHIITIETPAKNAIRIDDAAKAITVADQHGNTFTMNAQGITLKSARNVTIEAAQDVVIKGKTVDVR